jgi:hypothetical protein
MHICSTLYDDFLLSHVFEIGTYDGFFSISIAAFEDRLGNSILWSGLSKKIF